jgi:diguanylate cyclase (GGDEF)-like protein/PAS domain S-box-containing protein
VTTPAIFSSRLRLGVTLAGILVGVAALAFALDRDVRQADATFTQHRNDLEAALARRLESADASLNALSGLHHAMTRLADQELSAFAQELEETYPYVRAIYQMRLVLAEQRAEYEAEHRDRGHPLFSIGELAAPLRLAPAPDRPRYMALDFVEPLEPAHARLLGLDFFADPIARQAIEHTVRTAQVAAAPAIGLDAPAFMLFKAVYKGFYIPTTPAEREAQAQGVYALVIDPQQLLQDIMGAGWRPQLRIWASQGGPESLLFERPGAEPSALARALLPAHRAELRLPLGASQFRIELVQPMDFQMLQPWHWLTLLLTLLGLYAAGVIVLHTRLRAAQQTLEAKEQLFHEKERAQVTLQSIGEAVLTTDPTGVVDFMNPEAEQLTGWSAGAAYGRHLDEIFSLVSEHDGKPLPDPIARALRDQDESEASAIMIRSDGATVAVVENAAAIRDRDGHFTGAVLIVRDVSRERTLLREMAYQAAHDPLTRLINRREFEREVALVVEDAHVAGNQHALMYIDLDQFKAINDSCGHMAGDQLLKQVAAHLSGSVRKVDRLARLGGDEFGVLLRDCDVRQALEVAESLRREVKDLRLHWEDKNFRISLSIGLVAITPQSGSLDEVLRAADAACYVAKDQGRNRVHLYQPDDDMLAQRTSDMQWLQRLRDAIDQDRLVLFCQEIRPLREAANRPPMCELLVRMLDDDGRLVPPMTFIPVAERYNLMFDLDLWVIRQAFSQLAELWRVNARDQRVFTINISGQSLDHPDLEVLILREEANSAVDPHRICFEITETSVIANMERALALMDRLRQRGFRFALDDFGTGLSSFAYLKKLPVDYLKIDGEFVRDIKHDPVDKAMVETIRHIGKVLGMATIAEAIEDSETCRLLGEMGVDYGQGYHLARPGPAEFGKNFRPPIAVAKT